MGSGNVAPKRAIEAPDAGRGLDAVAIDAVNNLLIVGAGGGGGGDRERGTRFLVFDRTANGNVRQKMTIRGPAVLGGPFAIYPPRKLILATNRPGGEVLAGDDFYLGDWRCEKRLAGTRLWR